MPGIEVNDSDGDVVVTIGGVPVDLLDVTDDCIIAECRLNDLQGTTGEGFPKRLVIETHSPDAFGTFFFHDLSLSSADAGIALDFRCHTPNKYWEGRFGLATFIEAIRDQVSYHENLVVTDDEVEDDWKGITLRRVISETDSLLDSIQTAAYELSRLLHSAEVALGGFQWKSEYEKDESLFCVEILLPLLRRMGFLFVKYSHGTKEYGKDFTFSEVTPFGNHRHYGLQAKAGDVKGGVNSEIDELLGQIVDAFQMPYHTIGSDEPYFISTFIIAISGHFTENAQDKISQKTPRGLVGSVYFLDRNTIEELVERFWNRK